MSFKLLKKNSAESLQKEINKATKATFFSDADQFWSPTVDKAGNGYAVIRLLPAPTINGNLEDDSWVEYYDHSFSRNGKWYIQRSLTTFGKGVKDPCSEYNSKLWNSGDPALKELVSGKDSKNEAEKIVGSKRRHHFIRGIYVIKDTGNPENEGKVFKFKHGIKLHEKFEEALKPKFPDQAPFNPYDFWEGADFSIRISKNAMGYRDYSSSGFNARGPLLDGDEDKLEAIYNQQYSLFEEIDPNNTNKYKTYEELLKALEYVVGPLDTEETSVAPTRIPSVNKPKPQTSKQVVVDDDGDDEDFFKRLASGDADDEIPF